MAGNNYKTPNKPFRKGKPATKFLTMRRGNPRLGGAKPKKRALVGK